MLKVRRLRLFLTFASIFSALSCHRPARSGALIDAYREADCVAPTMARGIEPQTRGWDARITIAGKATARIQGFDAVGGQIDVHYGRDGESVTAVNYRDFIYPSDVRLNDRHDRLYVKARGFAAAMSKETWLHEYDLQNRKEVRRQLIDLVVLPEECPMPQR